MKKLYVFAFLLLATVTGFSQSTVSSSTSLKEQQGAKVSFLSEDFETFSIPGNMFGWTQIQTNTIQTWVLGTVGAYEGSQYIRIYPDYTPATQDEWITSPNLDLTGTIQPQISFWWSALKSSALPPSDNYDFTVLTSVNGGSWTTLWNEETDTNSWVTYTWKMETLNLPANCINSSDVRIAFWYYGYNGGECGFDYVQVFDDAMGIADQQIDGVKLNIYPNPASDYLILESSEKINAINLYNNFGTLVLSKTINDNNATIEIGGLVDGFYFVDIQSRTNKFSRKLSIAR